MKKIISNSLEDTKNIGVELAKILKKGDLVVLNGDLGSGKTALVTGFMSYYKKDDEVSSPTFTIVNEHKVTDDLSIFHFDVYRLNDVDEFYAIGGDEYFDKGITFMEWGENVKSALPNEYLEIELHKSPKDENVRLFYLIPHGNHYQELVDSLKIGSYDEPDFLLTDEEMELQKAYDVIKNKQGALPGLKNADPVAEPNEEVEIDEKDMPWELIDAEDAYFDGDEPPKKD